jgi:hypothetical protein
MDRDEILQRVTDALCGELDREEMAELQAALATDPVLAAEAGKLEHTWLQLGEIIDEERQDQAALDRVFHRIVNRDQTELSDEDLDEAAGGASTPNGKQ